MRENEKTHRSSNIKAISTWVLLVSGVCRESAVVVERRVLHAHRRESASLSANSTLVRYFFSGSVSGTCFFEVNSFHFAARINQSLEISHNKA
jgi:hypothetical protein